MSEYPSTIVCRSLSQCPQASKGAPRWCVGCVLCMPLMPRREPWCDFTFIFTKLIPTLDLLTHHPHSPHPTQHRSCTPTMGVQSKRGGARPSSGGGGGEGGGGRGGDVQASVAEAVDGGASQAVEEAMRVLAARA